jgi:murein tripeptide amidase MpaA
MRLPLDRYLRYDELTSTLHGVAAEHPDLVSVESYGRSHEGRELWLVTITDASTGAHDTKPAHWVDANIHSVEVTAGVAALSIIDHLVNSDDALAAQALASRTFYVVPRVNPDGVELALGDRPRFLRSSVRRWPWADGWVKPGLHASDIDGDGRILSMRVPDPDGAWVTSSVDPRLLVHRPIDFVTGSAPTYRLLQEGLINDHDGFTIPMPRTPEGLDLNRNFPAGWSTTVTGSGDHPTSEPEIDALVRAIVARPNICGYNAFHTSGGVLLRPSSTAADASLPALDVWTWTELGKRGVELTTYPVHSVFEDFTWDKTDPMSGAADDWVYEHLGVYGWTTEFWDAVACATGGAQRLSTRWWYEGPTPEQELAVLRWSDVHAPSMYVDWYPFEHPQLGAIELGGWEGLTSWTNPPAGEILAREVQGHASFAVHQAMAAPCLAIREATAEAIGEDVWRIRCGIANTGWLPTVVSERARKDGRVLPVVAEVSGAEVLGGPARVEVGHLEGRRSARFDWNDGTPERALVTWLVRARPGAVITLAASHQRAGRATVDVTLE